MQTRRILGGKKLFSLECKVQFDLFLLAVSIGVSIDVSIGSSISVGMAIGVGCLGGHGAVGG